MKILSLLLTCLFFMSGCSSHNNAMDQALSIRSRLNKSGCEFYTQIIADYGDYTHAFEMQCSVDEAGKLVFTVIKPETISGISGFFDAGVGKLTFDDKLLAFSPLSEGLLTPVAAPWVFLCALKGGYISCAGEYDDGYRIQIDDTYEDCTLMLDIITDMDARPVSAEIYWDGSRIVSMRIDNFKMM